MWYRYEKLICKTFYKLLLNEKWPHGWLVYMEDHDDDDDDFKMNDHNKIKQQQKNSLRS